MSPYSIKKDGFKDRIKVEDLTLLFNRHLCPLHEESTLRDTLEDSRMDDRFVI
jgi:hypothetical protein